MLYFKIEAVSENLLQPRRKTEEEFFKKDVCYKAADVNEKMTASEGEIIIVDIRKETIVAVMITPQTKEKNIRKTINNFFQKMKYNIVSYSFKEMTVEHAGDGIKLSAENGFVSDETDILDKYGIDDFDSTEESIVSEPVDQQEKRKMMDASLCFSGVEEELKRIGDSTKKRFYGHPVHYVIMGDDKDQSSLIVKLLVGRLYKAKRVISKRLCTIDFDVDYRGRFSPDVLSLCNAFKVQNGATIVLKPIVVSEFGVFLDNNYAHIQTMCEVVKKHHCDTLSIFLIGRSDETTLRSIRKELGDIRLVVFKEQLLNTDKAARYLTSKAKENNLRNYSGLLEQLPNTDSGFYPEELNKRFSAWYNKYVCTSIYPQYKEIEYVSNSNTEEAKGCAHDKLMKMVGLKEAKKVLSEVIAYHTAQKYYTDFGLDMNNTSKHMVFTGNPGSAKTTVARLFATILKDNGVIQSGVFVEAGRSEIVDRYLGGTAPRVKELFQKAEGGILFIDEAYSLIDGQRGLYGDEAINTIVQEMENNRDKVIVIFAGYPEKMNQFLDNNPGLRSRIAFHVPFEDYSSDELIDILKLMAKDKNLNLTPEVVEKVKPIFEEATTHKEYGNGRYVRNMFEKAVMHQACRLVKYQRSELTSGMVSTLIAEDFEIPSEYASEKCRRIGFSI